MPNMRKNSRRSRRASRKNRKETRSNRRASRKNNMMGGRRRRTCRKSRRASRKDRKSRRSSRKNNMMGGRRSRSGKGTFTLTRRVARPLGELASGASNTIVTAGKTVLSTFDTLVKGAVKTGKKATGAVNRTISAAVSRRNRRNRRH